MTTDQVTARDSHESPALFSGQLLPTLLRLGGLAVLDAAALWFLYQLISNEDWFLAIAIVIITVGLNAIFLNDKLYPFRWLSPGLVLMVLVVAYPTLFTVYTAFTNYKTGNLLTRIQAIESIQNRPEYRFLPEGEQYFDATAYRNEAGDFLLWLTGRDTDAIFIARENTPLTEPTAAESGLEGVTLDGDTITIAGYEALTDADSAALAARESLSYSYPYETITIAAITDDTADAEEGIILDLEQDIAVDFGSRRPQEYAATLLKNTDAPDLIALWLVTDRGDTILARPDAPVVINSTPQTIGDFRVLTNRERTAVTQLLPTLLFGEADNPIFVDATSATRVGRFQSRYEYDAGRDLMLDQITGATYAPVEGTFTLNAESVPEAAGELDTALTPGYFVPIGLDNFERLFTDERLRGPFVTIFIWTVVHATLTVVIVFTVGLGMALLLNDPIVPQRKLFRTIILVPYAIPAFISTVIWRGMFSPQLGVINEFLESVFGAAPDWYSDPFAAKAAILLIQMWLGFPYMMLVTTGALQALPGDIFEAARVDGANALQRFRHLTLPMLLVAVGPLLIAAFAFNFNNFTVIELYNQGGPPIANSSVPAGHTDILITYSYAQAFGTAGGTDYAFAGAISIFIFVIVAIITLFNFRFTRTWEEVSENV